MLWYVIQTYTGKEQKLIEMIRRIIPAKLYGECFTVYHEQLRIRGQENQIHVERVFPGYAFISSDDPQALFLHLKSVPAMSKMMADGEFCFTPLEDTEAEFMLSIMDTDHVIRLTYVATDGHDHVTYLSGPLENCGGHIAGYRFRKRFALVRLSISGQEKEVRMGIILNDDIRREVTYGKVEAPISVPERYHAGMTRKEAKEELKPGDPVRIIGGAFEGMTAVVAAVRKDTVKIRTHLFGRDLTAEVSIENVGKGESSGAVVHDEDMGRRRRKAGPGDPADGSPVPLS